MVDLNVTVRTILRDRAGTVTFDRIDVVQTSIPIEDIKDPLYSVGTQGRAPQPVQRSTVVPPYITATNVTTGLQQLVNGTLYIASTHAPSFLQRFEGNLSSSPYGIQSLVDVQELRAQDLTIETCKSVVDYVYFGPTSSAPNYYIINMDQANFWLDDANIAIYNASGKVVGTRPCP